MNDINSGYDRWLTTPPDDDAPEQEYCESCGEPMELRQIGYNKVSNQEWTCENVYCPDRIIPSNTYNGAFVLDMANHLAEVEQELSSTRSSLSFVRRKLALTEGRLVEREGTIEDLELKLTPSQSKEVVRDTDYQIRRMDDAIQLCEDEYTSGYELPEIRKEWNECKKILNRGE